MRLYLVQHAEARDGLDDGERILSERGWKTVGTVLKGAAPLGLPVSLILHSRKIRARQTAEAYAAVFRPDGGVRETVGLNPMDDPRIIQAEIHKHSSGLMLVGHLPHLSRLAGSLLCGDPDREIIRVRNGAIFCLEGEGPPERWSLLWVLHPELLQELGDA